MSGWTALGREGRRVRAPSGLAFPSQQSAAQEREVTRRYRDPVEMLELRADRRAQEAPAVFRWRGRTYRVVEILGFWREDAGYWAGGGLEVPQRDLWRVETDAAVGVCELVRERDAWRLARVWD